MPSDENSEYPRENQPPNESELQAIKVFATWAKKNLGNIWREAFLITGKGYGYTLVTANGHVGIRKERGCYVVVPLIGIRHWQMERTHAQITPAMFSAMSLCMESIFVETNTNHESLAHSAVDTPKGDGRAEELGVNGEEQEDQRDRGHGDENIPANDKTPPERREAHCDGV